MSLRWEEQDSGAWYAYSGTLVIGMCGPGENGWIWWNASQAVNMRHIAKTHGELKSYATAKRAIERAWTAWLAEAGLRSIEG